MKNDATKNNTNTTAQTTHFTNSPITLYCGEWQADDGGIYRVEENSRGQAKRYLACPHPILPVERLVNIDTGMEKLHLAYYRDDAWKYVVVDCTTCYNKQHIIALADRGIFVTGETARELVRYLSDMVRLNMDIIPVCRSVGRLGWIGDDFAPYLDNIRYDTDLDYAALHQQVCTHGDRQAWFDLAKDIRKSTIVRLLMAASFASVLIERVGTLPFVFHLWGTTSFGKTVSLMVAMSIWGDPALGKLTRSMNMTQNAMARTAAFLHNLPFGADELQQVKNRWDSFDSLIMYLTEGIDRGRAKAFGGVEEVRTWRNCFIFTGEQPITQDNSGGGTKNRVIEVEVTEPLYRSGHTVANTVKTNYGFAGREYIDYVKTIPAKELQERLQAYADVLMTTCDTTDKQAYSMGLMLLADELARQCIFPDEASLTIAQVQPFLHSNKTVDVSERAYEWCMNWVAKNSNRFMASANEVYGKMDDIHVWIVKDVLVQAMRDAGFEFNAVSRKWAEAGYLVPTGQNRYVHRNSINGVSASCIKLNLPNSEIEVKEAPPTEFVQPNLY